MLRRTHEKPVSTVSADRAGISKIGLGLGTAMASVALAACTASAPPAETSFSNAQSALADGKVDRALEYAENAVLASPRSASYRALLGAAYMEAGRFEAAATSFGDAITLGDSNPRTVLSHALALTAVGDKNAALQTLDANSAIIAPADLGLAMALAGTPERGVHILVNEVRAGNTNGKVRQNLAYSYALAGNWSAARVMAGEDVPADQLDARIAQWAAMATPEAHRKRVAMLLDVPSGNSVAMPTYLALSNFPSQKMMVAEAQEMRADEVNEDVAANGVESEAEIAAIDPDQDTAKADEVARPSVATLAAIEPVAEQPSPTSAERSAPRFVSNAVVQKTPVAKSRTPERVAAAPASEPTAKPSTQRRAAMSQDGAARHLVQLGSFDSRAVAQEKWDEMKKRFPGLSARDAVITEAEVDGRTYFRLAASGFGRRSAQAMCNTVKASGRGCFSYAASNPPAGAVKRVARLAARAD